MMLDVHLWTKTHSTHHIVKGGPADLIPARQVLYEAALAPSFQICNTSPAQSATLSIAAERAVSDSVHGKTHRPLRAQRRCCCSPKRCLHRIAVAQLKFYQGLAYRSHKRM